MRYFLDILADLDPWLQGLSAIGALGVAWRLLRVPWRALGGAWKPLEDGESPDSAERQLRALNAQAAAITNSVHRYKKALLEGEPWAAPNPDLMDHTGDALGYLAADSPRAQKGDALLFDKKRQKWHVFPAPEPFVEGPDSVKNFGAPPAEPRHSCKDCEKSIALSETRCTWCIWEATTGPAFLAESEAVELLKGVWMQPLRTQRGVSMRDLAPGNRHYAELLCVRDAYDAYIPNSKAVTLLGLGTYWRPK